MWINYFFQIQKKYTMQLSTQKPLVIRLDGKDVTKNTEINFFHKYNGSFSDSLEKSAWYFSNKYKCYSLFGTDEISFIFPNTSLLFNDIQNDSTYFSNETISVFSQYFFDYFNTLYKGEKVFWHGKCFSIPKEKILSYSKYRMGSIQNVLVTYFLKKNDVHISNEKLNVRLEHCKKLREYNILKENINGTLFFEGDKLDIDEFIKGNIVKTDNTDIKNNINKAEEFEEIDIEIEI